MASMSKPQTRVKDRISALPDPVVCHILSFLPTACAVRTTVLSTRWKNIWTCVPNLDFDDYREFGRLVRGRYTSESARRFTTFVDRVLFFRDSSDIKRLRLQIQYLDDFPRIDNWICTAVRRNVVELDLYLDNRQTFFPFPETLFRCKTLVVLKLSSNCLTFAAPTSGCFPNLKFLHVTVDSEMCSMENLFSYCPVLEDLTIDGLIDSSGVFNFNISAPELKALRLNLDEVTSEHNFYINAPKLQDLDFKEVALSNYYFQNAKSLVNASIVLIALSSEEQTSFPAHAIALLSVVSNVKCLSLSAHVLEAQYLPPCFGNLIRLELELHDCHYSVLLAEFLKRSPELVDLVLNDRTTCVEKSSVPQWNPPQCVPYCLLRNLRTISIRGFRGQQVEMEVAKYLLKNGIVLNKMTIYTGVLCTEEKELYKAFCMFHRRSMTCQVEFIKM